MRGLNVIIVIITYLFIISCGERNVEYKIKQEKKFVKFGKKVYGIEIGELKYNDVIKVLNRRGVKYKIYYYDDFPKVPNIETTYFIGTGIPQEFIKSVSYNFNPFSGKNDKPDITIEIKCVYFEYIFKDLVKKFGEPTSNIKRIKKNATKGDEEYMEIYYSWESSKESIGTLDLISLIQYEYKYSSERICLLLMRPKDYGCQEVH